MRNNMPLPEPREREKTKAFIARCMDAEVMKTEYPQTQQRYAVCCSQAERAGRDVKES